MKTFKLVDRLNPIVTFSVIGFVLILTLVLGYYSVAGAIVLTLLISLIEGVKIVPTKKSKPYQKYGME